ncbi:dihydroorotase [candidate division KSB1 bacterium]|nr:dihydroorotase [candidate division KSB1 bacterium]
MLKIEKILLHGGTVLDLENGKSARADVAIVDGKIRQVGEIETESFGGDVIDVSGAVLTPGLMDMHVHLREPGREDEETVASGCAAAMAGGFTAVCAMPNTEPECDTQEVVQFIKKRAEAELVDVYPIGAITKKRAGREISEMADMIRAGAVAFSDDGSPVLNTAVMKRALEYSSMYFSPIIDHCEDPFLFEGGHMNESKMSTLLGLPPIPPVGEEIMIGRNISLVRYVGGHLHVAHISTKRGVELVRQAKEEGLPVTCEVAPHHLVFSDEDLKEYDTNLKMNPPLRTPEDVEALKAGLKDGTIDVIASDHAPHSVEEKQVEFVEAPFGILGLETMLGIIITKIVKEKILSLEQALEKMCISPRRICRLPIPRIKKGEAANISIFDPDKKWTVDVKKFKSLSRNSPYDGWKLNGVVLGVVNKGLYQKS